MIRGICIACGSPWKVPPAIAGKKASCHSCGNVFVVPPASPVAATPDDDPLGFLDLDDPPPSLGVQARRPPGVELAAGIAGFVVLMAAFLFVWSSRRAAEGPAPGAVADATLSGALLLLVILVGLLLYVLPSIIAFQRGHQNAPAIFALNILLGWAFIGWVGALVWALTEARSRDHYHYHR